MKYRKLGVTGLWVSEIGLGLWKWGDPARDGSRIGEPDGFPVLDRAMELGVTHWDTACSYNMGSGNSERLLGRYFASRGSSARDRVVLATKLRNPVRDEHEASREFTPNEMGSSRRYILRETERCLERLKTDRIDILYHHIPELAADGTWEVPLEETWSAFDDLVRQGKVLYLAVSNRNAVQLEQECQALSRVAAPRPTRIAAVQNKYNLLERESVACLPPSTQVPGTTGAASAAHEPFAIPGPEEDFLSRMSACGPSLIPLMPLAAGMLTGRYRRDAIDRSGRLSDPAEKAYAKAYLTDRNFSLVESLCAMADRKACTPAALAIAWLLANPQVASVIAGVTRMDQLEANVRAAGVELSTREREELDRMSRQD